MNRLVPLFYTLSDDESDNANDYREIAERFIRFDCERGDTLKFLQQIFPSKTKKVQYGSRAEKRKANRISTEEERDDSDS